MATRKKAKPPVRIPEQVELEDAARCFERWAQVIREGLAAGKDLGHVSLTWSRKKPEIVNVNLSAAPAPDGFRGDLRNVMRRHNEIERKQYNLTHQPDETVVPKVQENAS